MVELSAVNRSVVGSNPTCGAIASIAQQVEHFHGKEEVSGSSPLGSFIECIITKVSHKEKAFFIAICGSSSVVEHHLAKVGVAGSNPVFRSIYPNGIL